MSRRLRYVLVLLAVSAACPITAAAGLERISRTSIHDHRVAGRDRRRPHRRTRRRHRATSSTGNGLIGSSPDPSGESMPVGDRPRWRQVLADDFTGSSLKPSIWRTYSGEPGGDPGGWFDPSHVSVTHGMLVLSAYRDAADGGVWATAGVSSSRGLAQTYGKYEVRFRFDAGVGISNAILLWPQDGSWPPEIDFSEDNGGDRLTNYATLHYGARNHSIERQLAINLTRWHTLGVEWTPGRLVYTVDGRDWASVNGSHVSAIPMVLDIQTQAWACGTSTWEQCPNAFTAHTVNLDVDWVVAYAMS